MYKNLSPEEAKALYDQGVPLIDVREVEEFAQARIPNAKLLPLSEFLARYHILNLEGGIVRWYRLGLPVDTTPVEEIYAATPYKEVGPREALVENGALVVDVREKWEYQEGHIPKAVNIPLSSLPQKLGELPKDRPILLVCNSGNRSGLAAEYLVSQGFDPEKVVNLEGGTYAWMTAGLKVER